MDFADFIQIAFQDYYRRARLWKYLAEYFPVSLVKTTDLSPDSNYILG